MIKHFVRSVLGLFIYLLPSTVAMYLIVPQLFSEQALMWVFGCVPGFIEFFLLNAIFLTLSLQVIAILPKKKELSLQEAILLAESFRPRDSNSDEGQNPTSNQ